MEKGFRSKSNLPSLSSNIEKQQLKSWVHPWLRVVPWKKSHYRPRQMVPCRPCIESLVCFGRRFGTKDAVFIILVCVKRWAGEGLRTRSVWMVTVVLTDREVPQCLPPPVRSQSTCISERRTAWRSASPACPSSSAPRCPVGNRTTTWESVTVISALFTRISSQEIPTMPSSQIVSSITTSSELQLIFPFLFFCKYAAPEMVQNSYCGKKTHLVSHLWVEIFLPSRPLFEGHALDTTTFLHRQRGCWDLLRDREGCRCGDSHYIISFVCSRLQ